MILVIYVFKLKDLRKEANENSDFKVNALWDILLKYFTPILLGIVIVTNIIKVIGGLLKAEGTVFLSNIVFGWGTVLIMLLSAIVFYNKRWTVKR